MVPRSAPYSGKRLRAIEALRGGRADRGSDPSRSVLEVRERTACVARRRCREAGGDWRAGHIYPRRRRSSHSIPRLRRLRLPTTTMSHVPMSLDSGLFGAAVTFMVTSAPPFMPCARRCLRSGSWCPTHQATRAPQREASGRVWQTSLVSTASGSAHAATPARPPRCAALSGATGARARAHARRPARPRTAALATASAQPRTCRQSPITPIRLSGRPNCRCGEYRGDAVPADAKPDGWIG